MEGRTFDWILADAIIIIAESCVLRYAPGATHSYDLHLLFLGIILEFNYSKMK